MDVCLCGCMFVSIHLQTLRGLVNHKSILVSEGRNTEHIIMTGTPSYHTISLMISLSTLLGVNFAQLDQTSCLISLFG